MVNDLSFFKYQSLMRAISTVTYRLLICILLAIPLSIQAQVTANFTADTTKGCGSVGVQFTDLSTGNITSRSWNFGNGNTSTLTNPFENFSTGVYTISLTVSDGVNSDTETKVAYIEVFSEPTANFTFTPVSGCTPLAVSFTSTSTPGAGAIVSYIWDVKDGSPAPNAASFTHTYQGGGPYQPSLQIIDDNGCSDSRLANGNITPTPSPVANFSTQNPPVGCTAPFTVNFINSSSGSALSYQWNFGDGQSSTQANPTHTYTALGNYTVRLIVSDPNCSDTLIRTNFVRLVNTVADFSTPSDTVCFGQAMDFTNLSLGATNFSWDFDDGSPRVFQKDPKHVFLDSGWFDVTLVSSAGSACIDQVVKQVYVEFVKADFDLDTLFNCDLPDTIQFLDRSFRAAHYDWRFGNYDDISRKEFSDLDSIANPTHIQTEYRRFSDTLIIESQFGCKDTMIKNVRYAEELLTKISVTGPNGTDNEYAGCLPFTVTLSKTTSGPGVYVSYDWDFGGGMTYNGQNPPPMLIDSVSVNTYTLTVTNNFGCTATDLATARADTLHDPAFSVTPDSVCMYDTIRIQMLNSVGNVYEFGVFTLNYGTGYVEDVLNYGLFSGFLDTGYTSASVKAGVFCDTTLVIDSSFYVNGPVFRPRIDTNCIAPLTVGLNSFLVGETRFYWDFGDGSPIDSINKNPIHTYPKDTVYNATLTAYNDTNGCPLIRANIRINLSQPIPPVRLPYEHELCRNNDSVRLYFNNSLLYVSSLWYLNGNFIGDFEDRKFDRNLFNDGKNDILFIGINEFGCRDTIHEYLFISNPIAQFTSDIQGGCIPFDVQMIDQSTSDTLIKEWQWFFSTLPGDTIRDQNPVITVNTTDDVRIRLRVIDSIGCVADTIMDDLISGGNLIVDFATSDDLNICVGERIQFFNRSSGDNLNSIWNFGDGVIDTINTPTVFHQFDSAGSFLIKLVGVDGNGCRDTLERYTVNVEAKPIANFTADTTTASCYPFAVNFSDLSGGNITSWRWDLGSQDSILLQNPFRNYLSPGNYTVRLIVGTANGCYDTLTRQDYIQISGPTASFQMSKDIVCLNEPITFTITNQSGVGSFRWAFGDGATSTANPATHIYTDTSGLIQPSLIIRDVLGNCEVLIRDSLTIREVIAKFSLDDTIGCTPFSPSITNEMRGEDSFSWDFGNGAGSTMRTPSPVYEQAGTYDLKLSVSSTVGCTDEAVIPVTVYESPVANLSGELSICVHDSTTLTGSGGIFYEWFEAGQLLASTASITLSPLQTTPYLLVVRNNDGCTDSLGFEIYVQQEPNYAAIGDTTIIIGEKVTMDAGSGSGFSYSWSPSNGLSCTSCPNPIAQPLETTEYILRITDAFGCFSILDTIRIEVIEEFSLEVPQAFSPNGDGVNDIIFAKGWGLKELIAFKIYNRFGELIFESTDFNIGWDGTFRGQDQVIETYVYTVEAKTYRDKILQKKGNITLLR